jgi:uncharacterized protein YjiS (DUF1127 family)
MTQHVLILNSYLTKPIESLLDWVKSIRVSYQKWKIFNQTYKELSSLSDYELRDIGISRGDIYSTAKGDLDMRRSVQINENLKGRV